MGTKKLNLGRKLKYPITITKLLKEVGDVFEREGKCFQYTFKWSKEVGDPSTGDVWQEEQTTIADWESPADGALLRWKIRVGQVLERDTACAEIDETCSHEVQYAGLCARCGKDMNVVSFAMESTDKDRASVNMIHDQTLLSVSQTQASRAEEETQRRLLKNRKLSLVVDLDQTIIHACIEPTVGEWQSDPSSPNYEAVKDVKKFQLNDDGPRGLSLGIWYYIKMRPGLAEFLAHVAELYELHVYTMGTRAYAQAIAEIVDPEHKLFGDRIISRDENGSMTAKTLSRLFPVDTKMVVIIDDRADVWPRNRQNLIKVVPYDFFVGIGDINSSFLPKRQDIQKDPVPVVNPVTATAGTEDTSKPAPEVENGTDIPSTANDTVSTQAPAETSEKKSALAELVLMGGGDNPTVRAIQAEEQVEFLEKQLIERPLLHMQQELEKEDEAIASEEAKAGTEGPNGSPSQEQPQPRHHLLKDDDQELIYLESHLTSLHRAFYEEYDLALTGAVGGRVAHLRPGGNKKEKISLNEETADLTIVPDIGKVMPRLKARTFAGSVMVLSGLIPLGVDPVSSEIVQQVVSFGASVYTNVSRKVTHLVASSNRTRTQKVRQAAKYAKIKIVNHQWLVNSMSKWKMEDEKDYLIKVHRDDRSAAESAHESDGSLGESDGSSDGDDSDIENEPLGSTQEDEDPDGVMPSDLDESTSPIENLQGFDWGGADDELADFLASGSEDDATSDAESVGSQSSERSTKSEISLRGRKHGRDETDDEKSTLEKRRRLATSRETGLKTVKIPGGSEPDLPTPEVTTGEDGGGEGGGNAEPDEDYDLEAEMLKEFEEMDSAASADESAGG